MNDQAVDNARREKRYERIREKVHTEYTNEVALLRERKDYIAAYEYFLELMQEPYHAGNLRQRVRKPLIGLFCIHAPLELLDAFGVHPVKLCSGSQTVQRVAASYLPVLMCPMLKSFMGNFDLQGESFKDYEMIVLPTTCDWVVKLPEIMGQPLDNVHYLELPHLKGTDKAQNRWLEEMYSLKKILEKAAQKRLSAQKLLDSIGRFTKLWALLEELKGFKRNGKISCVWYTLLTNTFLHDDLERWSENIVKVLEQLRDAPVVMSEGKVFVAGSPVVFPNLKLLQLIEQAGMTVIADDLCSSERILPGGVVYRDTSESGLIRALAERYHKACICPTFADNDRRINGILSTAEAQGIRGVIFNLLKGCHPYDIEAITIEQKLKKHGLKFLKIETDYGKEDSQNILTRLEAFSKTL